MSARLRTLPVVTLASAGFLAIVLCGTVAVADVIRAGLVVERVQPNYAADRAGIRAGDVLLAWSQSDSDTRQPLRVNLDLLELERERQPLGAITLHGSRGNGELAVEMGPGEWRLQARPQWDEPTVAEYRAATSRMASDPGEPGFTAALDFARRLEDDDGVLHAAAFLYSAAESESWQGRLPRATRFYETAIENLSEAEHTQALAILNYDLGMSLIYQRRLEEAHAAFTFGRDLSRRISASRLGVAANTVRQGSVATNRGDFDTARAYLEEALWLYEQLAPGSPQVAGTLAEFGRLAAIKGDLPQGEDYFRRALDILDARIPNGIEVAGYTSNLANVVRLQGDQAGAEALLERAMSLVAELDPESRTMSAILNNLGAISEDRGNLRAAEHYVLASLALDERIQPDSSSVPLKLDNLGVVALSRGDFIGSRRYHERAYELLRESAPDSMASAIALSHLGNVSLRLQDDAGAERYLREAMKITGKQTPIPVEHARNWLGLARVELSRGDQEAARRSLFEALSIFHSVAADGRGVAETTLMLGDIGLSAGELESAEGYFRRAAAIADTIAPRTHLQAMALYGIARVHRGRQEREPARRAFELAIDALEAQYSRLGGGEQTRAEVRSRYVEIYDAFIDFLLDVNDTDAAFDVFERSRSKVLLDMLNERDLLFVSDLPQTIERERRSLMQENRWLQLELSNSHLPADIARRQQALESNRRALAEVDEEIRERAPRFAELHDVSPVTLGNLNRSLQPGTAVLSYHLADDEARVFVVSVRNEQLSELPWSEAEVTRIAEIFPASADVYTGTDATETRAKAIGSDTRYVHFAAHALLNERQPMDTAIALTRPAERSTEDDGFLQVWEIYEGLRLNTDLVVLSACETALGTGYRGEGLIGLTRAFQYAGASSVLASLWQVNDRSTSQLMADFYARLDAGIAIEDALREAQLEMIRGNERKRPWRHRVRAWFTKEASDTYAHPYHWSGFVLNGAGG